MGHPKELSPHQSVTTLLVSVEDLINMAMGPEDKNVVNYKLIQTVLHILARQMRLLEQRVEIRVTEYITHREQAQKEEKEKERDRSKHRPRTKSEEIQKAEKAEAREQEKQFRTAEKERRNIEKALQKEKEKAERERAQDKEKAKDDRGATKDRDKEERASSKDREKADKQTRKEREKEEKGASKERDKADKAATKEREKEERGASKERDKADKAAAKDKEKEDRGASKDRERADKAAMKEKEKEEKASAKADRDASKDRERAEKTAAKDKEKEGKAATKADKEREKGEKEASKDRERAEKAAAKDKEREEKASTKAAAKDKEREEKASTKADRDASKDRERADKAAAKDREKEEKASSKADRDASKERERDEKSAAKADKEAAKEREREEKAAAKSGKDASKEREKDEKAAAKADKEASKEREREEKAAAKADKEALKERERDEKASAKADKAASKDKEREERAAAKDERASAKDREKEEKAQSKEKERAEKSSAKDERATSKEREEAAKGEKPSMKDREQEIAGRDQEGTKAGAKGKTGKGADTGIAVKEEARDKEKILVVEKGPTTRPGAAPGSRSNIEVVTRSQFDLLKDIVTDLKDKAGPLPMPSMPQNKELLQRLSQGTASLTDMMGAMQVSARVVAAEQAIGRMGGILTQLATAGALPEDIAGQVGEVTMELETELQEADARAKEVVEARGEAADLLSLKPGAKPRVSASRKSILSSKSRASTMAGVPGMGPRASVAASMISGLTDKGMPKVTHPQLDDAMRLLKDDLIKSMTHATAKSTAAAENSMSLVKSVAEKLETALKVNSRITTLHAMVIDYAEQLRGFDVGLTTQMQSFSEQMTQMRGDLGAGLKLLETVNNNAETAAVMELTERYESLVSELDHTLQAHSSLDITQVHLGDDLRNLVGAVEMLREQKADRDEVLDGLRDKADMSRLAGLLTEKEFYANRVELEARLAVCHEKFHRQDSVWMQAVKDLKEIINVKADLIHLLGTREEMQTSLEMLQEMCAKLALVLGEPKAAALTRKLTRGATCAACMAPALMSPRLRAVGPPRLPAARPPPAGAPADLCDLELKLPPPPDTREHMCNRWVGGSHTLLTDAVSRLRAPPPAFPAAPISRYTGYGEDGRLYRLEEELLPCLECNKLSDEADGMAAQAETPNAENA